MKLHDLTVGHRFSFIGKHRGKVFEVVGLPDGNSMLGGILFQSMDDAWLHQVPKGSKLWDSEVELHGVDRTVTLTPNDIEKLDWIFYTAYTSVYSEVVRSMINEMHSKLTGLPGRRTVLTEGE